MINNLRLLNTQAEQRHIALSPQPPNLSIALLKQHAFSSLPPTQVRLFLQGRELADDEATLSDLAIHDGAVIHYMIAAEPRTARRDVARGGEFLPGWHVTSMQVLLFGCGVILAGLWRLTLDERSRGLSVSANVVLVLCTVVWALVGWRNGLQ